MAVVCDGWLAFFMTQETYENLVRVQDKRIARARITGMHSELSEACEEKEKLAAQWRREQLVEENEQLRRDVMRWRKDAALLDSGTILLSCNGERVHFVGQDLREAIDAGIAELSLRRLADLQANQ